MNKTKKVTNLSVTTIEVANKNAGQALKVTDKDHNEYSIMLKSDWSNYQRYNIGQRFLIRNCRKSNFSNELFFVRIKH
jgi:hypothetical protein